MRNFLKPFNTMNIVEPNLFSFATSELSQDAFFCWLLSWSKESFANSNPLMYERSRFFLTSILAPELDFAKIKVSTLKIERQYKKIDFIVIINKNIVLLFEDKIATKNHSNQLKRYSDIVEQKFPSTQFNLLKIYLKSDYTWKAEERDVKKQGYKIININNIAPLLLSGSKNEIYENFYHHINSKLDYYNTYKTIKKEKWDQNQWFGFYHALAKSKKLNYVNFGKFHSGKTHWFIVAWRDNILNNQCNLSLEIFSRKLLIKAHINDKSINKREYRNELTPALIDEFGIENCKISNRTGNIMTLFTIKNFPIISPETEIINFQTTVNKLQSLVEIFNKFCNKNIVK